MGDQVYRLGRHRGAWCAVKGRGRNKQRISLGIKAGARTRDDAARRVKELNRDDASRALNGAATVAVIYDAYVKDREADGVASIRRMREVWTPLAPHFGHLLPDQIDKKLCRDYIALRRGMGLSNGGIRSELIYLSASMGFGKEAKLYTGDRPKIHRPPAGRPRERWLTHDEAAKLIAGARAFHIKLWLHLALATAGRPSHILQLTWDRVTLRKWTHPDTGAAYYGSVNLDDPEREATKKGRARVPLNQEAYEALTLAQEMATTKWVIEYDGRPVAKVIKGVAAAAARAGLKGVTPYVLRHTAGVWMAQAGIPMAEISQYMGHTSTAITERVYARFHPDYLQRAADALRVGGSAKQIEDKRGDGA